MFQKGQMEIPAGDIFQIAELSVIKSGEITEHTQFCDEITYAISGKATIYSGDTIYEIHAGQAHFIKKGEYHKIVASEESNFHYYCIGFLLNSDYTDISIFTDLVKELKSFLIEDEGNIQTLFSLLLNEFYIHDSESTLMIHSYFCQILVLIYRILSGKSKEKLHKVNTSTSNHAVYRALKYIDREFIRLTNVKEVAQALSYSEYYLSHIFKEKMDMTMKDYLLQKKIITATELLANSNMSVGEIADLLNFSSLHTFGQAFKRYMKMSASEFRKKMVDEPQ
jgi:AraC-like DNA-binding protein/mannose-6-phosphate isomerase-like protein (cupin superfamily)